MQKYMIGMVVVMGLQLSAAAAVAETRFNDSVVVLPQVAKGDSIDTVIIFINTSTTTALVGVEATDDGVLEPTTLELGPLERQELQIRGAGEPVTGAVRIESDNTLTVEGRITTRSTSGDALSQATILAAPLHSELVIPVSYHTSEIENTGIAVYFGTGGVLDLEVYDEAGDLILGTTTIIGGMALPIRHDAYFVNEIHGLEPLLAEGFTGSVRLSFTGMGLAAAALYTNGKTMWTAQVQPVKEAERPYLLYLAEGVPAEILQEMADQYGFRLGEELGESWGIFCTDEVARAVERDFRVSRLVAYISPVLG